jgi:hypothetical protein
MTLHGTLAVTFATCAQQIPWFLANQCRYPAATSVAVMLSARKVKQERTVLQCCSRTDSLPHSSLLALLAA